MERNRFVDMLKGFSILLILITHFKFLEGQRLQLLFPFWVDMAVPMFMFLSGYVTMLSYQKNGIDRIEETYTLAMMVPKAIRFTIPYFLVWVVEYGLFILHHGKGLNFPDTLRYFAQGADGPGAYYYPLMMQFIVVFPLIYFLIRSQGFRGVVISFFVTYFLEFLKNVYQMEENTYCLLIFRYVFIIAVGAYVASDRYEAHVRMGVVALLLGIAFLVVNQYLGINIPYINYWKGTSVLGCLYIAPILTFAMNRCKGWKCAPLELLGKASYNIFLVQKVFYIYPKGLYDALPGEWIDLPAAMAVCLAIGVLFYLIESPLTTKLCRWAKKQCSLE